MENRGFYTYRHIRLDTNTPFHVGKGTGKRAWQKCRRNPYWQNIAKGDYIVEIIMENLTEEEAYAKEIEFIKLYKSCGWCETNLADGGKGASGNKRTEESLKRQSDWYKTHENPFLGKKHSEESLKKMSDSLRGKIPWNKGKKCSPESIQKMKESQKGHTPWNKGKKTGKAPWNKGLTKETDERVKKNIEGMSRSLRGNVPWNKGKTEIYSSETKKRISEKVKLWWAKRKEKEQNL